MAIQANYKEQEKQINVVQVKTKKRTKTKKLLSKCSINKIFKWQLVCKTCFCVDFYQKQKLKFLCGKSEFIYNYIYIYTYMIYTNGICIIIIPIDIVFVYQK